MSHRVLWWINGVVILLVSVILFVHFAFVPSQTAVQPERPGPAAVTPQASYLVFAAYPSGNIGQQTLDSNDVNVKILVYPLDENGNPIGEPQVLFNQPDPPACETDKILPSPNGHYLAIQYNCHDNQFTRLLNLAASPLFTDLPLSSSSITAVPTPALPDSLLPRGYFLDWSPDGNWLLFRHTDTDQVSLLAADGSSQIPLTALPVGTYRATFTPDGQSLTIGATRGLGFGSEIGTLNLLDGNYTQLRQFPNQIVAYPVWSPDGSQLAYILMPDSNIPFTVGELWLADSTTGEPLTLLGEVDAGHGYAPVWSPDGSTIAYVYRENPHSIRANQMTHELYSNIYRVELSTGIITPLTQFNETLVYGPTWSPDSQQLLFTANDAIWLLDVIHGEAPIQINRTDTARHPAWLVLSTP